MPSNATLDQLRRRNRQLQEEVELLRDALERGSQRTGTVDVALHSAERRHGELRTAHRAAHLIASSLDLDAVLGSLLNEASQLIAADAVSVYLHDPVRDDLVMEAPRTPSRLRIDGFLTRLCQHHDPIVIDDLDEDDRPSASFFEHVVSLVAVPLLHQRELIGVLIAIDRQPRRFDHDDLLLLTTLAAPAAAALANARLYWETKRRLFEVDVLQDVMLSCGSTLDSREIIDRTVAVLRRAFSADRVDFLVPEMDGETLRAHCGSSSPSGLVLSRTSSHAGRVYVNGIPEILDDLLASGGDPNPDFPDMRSQICVPILVGKNAEAVLSVASLYPGVFSLEDLQLLEAVGSQLSIVLENARLFEAERELRRLVEQSRRDLVESEKLAAMGRLAASLAHEINNPLQGIHNSLSLLKSYDLDEEERRQFLEIADTEATRLMTLVEKTLDLTRPRTHQKPAATDLREVAEAVKLLTRKLLQQGRMTFTVMLQPGVDAVLAEPGAVQQIMLNLVLNAIEATPAGGQITIAASQSDPDWVVLRVVDSGAGVPTDAIGRLFEPFFSTKPTGMGLGLSVSHQLVEENGGTIEIEQVPTGGTAFLVRLPSAGSLGLQPMSEDTA